MVENDHFMSYSLWAFFSRIDTLHKSKWKWKLMNDWKWLQLIRKYLTWGRCRLGKSIRVQSDLSWLGFNRYKMRLHSFTCDDRCITTRKNTMIKILVMSQYPCCCLYVVNLEHRLTWKMFFSMVLASTWRVVPLKYLLWSRSDVRRMNYLPNVVLGEEQQTFDRLVQTALSCQTTSNVLT